MGQSQKGRGQSSYIEAEADGSMTTSAVAKSVAARLSNSKFDGWLRRFRSLLIVSSTRELLPAARKLIPRMHSQVSILDCIPLVTGGVVAIGTKLSCGFSARVVHCILRISSFTWGGFLLRSCALGRVPGFEICAIASFLSIAGFLLTCTPFS